MNAIETRHLGKTFGRVTAVWDLNLSIPSGAIYGFIGPNGAGKTTTLRMLSGLLAPTTGEVLIAGQPLDQAPRQARQKLGYMPDFFGLYQDLKVWEYLDFFARCYSVPAEQRQRTIDELLELVDLSGKRDAFVQTLSRGMQQRLCLAHTLVHDPQILLLDEPASGLDPQARVEIRELLRELGQMGKTIMVSSHILSELAEICDHIGIIEQGRLLASGPIHEIRRRVLEGRILHIRVLERQDELIAYLQGRPDTNGVHAVLDEVECTLVGDDSDQVALLKDLLEAGFAIAAFADERRDLEDLFFRITQGKVS